MPQPSNRAALVEAALECIDRLPPERVTARAIVGVAGANLASIGYHFGSKEELVTEAVVLGLDRWLAEIAARIDGIDTTRPAARLAAAWRILDATRPGHDGLARTFVAAVAMARHNARVRKRLIAGFTGARRQIAAVLGLGADAAGIDTGGLLLAMFHGLLLAQQLDGALAIEGARRDRAQARLRALLPRAAAQSSSRRSRTRRASAVRRSSARSATR